MLQHIAEETGLKFKDGAFIGYGMVWVTVRLITRFGNQYATTIRIERPAEIH